MKRAIYMDRDGTIIEDAHYVREVEKVILLPGAGEALRLLKSQGYLLFVLSNQSGVGRGIISDVQFKEVHAKVVSLLKAEGVEIDEYGYCFHRPEDACACRKPGIALIRKEFSGSSIDLKKSFVVGDRDTDLGVALALGAKPVLVRTGKGVASEHELAGSDLLKQSLVYSDLLEFAQEIVLRSNISH